MVSYDELIPYVDFGNETFDALDVEIFMLDNEFFQIAADDLERLTSCNEAPPLATTHIDNIKVIFKNNSLVFSEKKAQSMKNTTEEYQQFIILQLLSKLWIISVIIIGIGN